MEGFDENKVKELEEALKKKQEELAAIVSEVSSSLLRKCLDSFPIAE